MSAIKDWVLDFIKVHEGVKTMQFWQGATCVFILALIINVLS